MTSDNNCKTTVPVGGVLTYIGRYRYVWPQRVWFLSGFSLTNGNDFGHFELGITLKTLASESLYGGQFTLSTQR